MGNLEIAMDSFDAKDLGSVQRIFRAKYKLDEPGFISHITQRAAGNDPLFMEDEDYLTMLSLFKECSQKYNLVFYALCLMQNHVHILIEPQEKNIAAAMHSIFSRYAAKFNRKYQRRGHLFSGRYRQAVCLDNSYLLTASVYIHLNPVRSGLTEKAIAYKWSSCRLYCVNETVSSFVNPEPVLRLIDEELPKAKDEYSRILDGGLETSVDSTLEQEGTIEKFSIQLAGLFPKLFQRIAGQQLTGQQAGQNQNVLDIIQLETLLHEAQFHKTSRSYENKQIRRYVIEQLLARGFKKHEIAERLGISRRTVYNVLSSDIPISRRAHFV